MARARSAASRPKACSRYHSRRRFRSKFRATPISTQTVAWAPMLVGTHSGGASVGPLCGVSNLLKAGIIGAPFVHVPLCRIGSRLRARPAYWPTGLRPVIVDRLIRTASPLPKSPGAYQTMKLKFAILVGLLLTSVPHLVAAEPNEPGPSKSPVDVKRPHSTEDRLVAAVNKYRARTSCRR